FLLQLSLNYLNFRSMIETMSPVGSDGPGCLRPELCPLSRVCVGRAVRIKELTSPPEVSCRLRELGFCEEQQVILLSGQPNVICQVCNTRLGLSAKLASSIWVEVLPVSLRAA